MMFSHMMKTGGTSFNQHLKGCYGSKIYVVTKSKNLNVDGEPYTMKDFEFDSKKKSSVRVISGHQIRPFVNFESYESNLIWMTFIRHPYKRYVSQYIHHTKRLGSIHNDLSFRDWIKKYNTSNYMVKFIAGVEDLELAKEILTNKFEVVGLTEELELSINMMRAIFLDKKFTAPSLINRNKTMDNNFKNYLLINELDLIKKNNDLDIELYNFVKKEIWPKQLSKIDLSLLDDKKNSSLIENINKIKFIVKRFKYHPGKLSYGNIKYFIRNW